MQTHLQPNDEEIRISRSPRRSPQITRGLTSPIGSVHLQHMPSLHTQPDQGLRTVDFFDDSSETESPTTAYDGEGAPDVELLERQASPKKNKKRHTTSTLEPIASKCEPTYSAVQHDHPPSATYEDKSQPKAARSISFNSSVSELSPNGRSYGPRQASRSSRTASGRLPRSSSLVEPSNHRHSSLPTTKADSAFDAYAIAHEITLNALMRDEGAMDKNLQSLALTPLQQGDQPSPTPNAFDPRSPRKHQFSTPPAAKKSVHVVPPPIDTLEPPRSLPSNMVRTPYPFPAETERHEDLSQASPPSAAVGTPGSATEGILAVSIRRSNPNSKVRITSLTIPASNDFTAVQSNGGGATDRHFKATDFDDAEFFHRLQGCYRELSGPMRFWSARSLTRLVVRGAADSGAYKDLRGTFSEEQIMQHYLNPSMGKSRYAFVHWARRLISSPPQQTPPPEKELVDGESDGFVGRGEHPEGLEFVVTWSAMRISMALLTVVVITIAAVLLWTFVGRSTPGALPSNGGFRGAGDRVGTAFLIGICVFLLGLSGIASWLGISWLVI